MLAFVFTALGPTKTVALQTLDGDQASSSFMLAAAQATSSLKAQWLYCSSWEPCALVGDLSCFVVFCFYYTLVSLLTTY